MTEWFFIIYIIGITIYSIVGVAYMKRLFTKYDIELAILRMPLEDLLELKKKIELNIAFRKEEENFLKKN